MVLDILAASVLIAFGILAIFFSIESSLQDKELMIVLLVSLLAIGGGIWLIVSKLTLGLVLKKLGGLVLGGIGLFLILGFPDVTEYQHPAMSKLGTFLGLIMVIFGLYLALF